MDLFIATKHLQTNRRKNSAVDSVSSRDFEAQGE